MRELRVQAGGRPLRVFYAFDPRRVAILLIGGDKTGRDDFYQRMIPLADRLYDEHLAAIAGESAMEDGTTAGRHAFERLRAGLAADSQRQAAALTGAMERALSLAELGRAHRTDRALDHVGVHLDAAVVEEGDQAGPVTLCIRHPALRGLRAEARPVKSVAARGLDQFIVVLHHPSEWRRPSLALGDRPQNGFGIPSSLRHTARLAPKPANGMTMSGSRVGEVGRNRDAHATDPRRRRDGEVSHMDQWYPWCGRKGLPGDDGTVSDGSASSPAAHPPSLTEQHAATADLRPTRAKTSMPSGGG